MSNSLDHVPAFVTPEQGELIKREREEDGTADTEEIFPPPVMRRVEVGEEFASVHSDSQSATREAGEYGEVITAATNGDLNSTFEKGSAAAASAEDEGYEDEDEEGFAGIIFRVSELEATERQETLRHALAMRMVRAEEAVISGMAGGQKRQQEEQQRSLSSSSAALQQKDPPLSTATLVAAQHDDAELTHTMLHLSRASNSARETEMWGARTRALSEHLIAATQSQQHGHHQQQGPLTSAESVRRLYVDAGVPLLGPHHDDHTSEDLLRPHQQLMLKEAQQTALIASTITKILPMMRDPQRREVVGELLRTLSHIDSTNMRSGERLRELIRHQRSVDAQVDALLLPAQEWGLLAAQRTLAHKEELLCSPVAYAEQRALVQNKLLRQRLHKLRAALTAVVMTSASITPPTSAPSQRGRGSATVKEVAELEASCKRLEELKDKLARELLFLRKDVHGVGVSELVRTSAEWGDGTGNGGGSSGGGGVGVCEEAVTAALLRESDSRVAQAVDSSLGEIEGYSEAIRGSGALLCLREGVASRQRSLASLVANNVLLHQQVCEAVFAADIAVDTATASGATSALLEQCGLPSGDHHLREGDCEDAGSGGLLVEVGGSVLALYHQRLSELQAVTEEHLRVVQAEVSVPELQARNAAALLLRLVQVSDQSRAVEVYGEGTTINAFSATLQDAIGGLEKHVGGGGVETCAGAPSPLPTSASASASPALQCAPVFTLPALPATVTELQKRYDELSARTHKSIRAGWGAVADTCVAKAAEATWYSQLAVEQTPVRVTEAQEARSSLLQTLAAARAKGQGVAALRHSLAAAEAQLAELQVGRRKRLTEQLEEQRKRLVEEQAVVAALRAEVAVQAAAKSAAEEAKAEDLTEVTVKQEPENSSVMGVEPPPLPEFTASAPNTEEPLWTDEMAMLASADPEADDSYRSEGNVKQEVSQSNVGDGDASHVFEPSYIEGGGSTEIHDDTTAVSVEEQADSKEPQPSFATPMDTSAAVFDDDNPFASGFGFDEEQSKAHIHRARGRENERGESMPFTLETCTLMWPSVRSTTTSSSLELVDGAWIVGWNPRGLSVVVAWLLQNMSLTEARAELARVTTELKHCPTPLNVPRYSALQLLGYIRGSGLTTTAASSTTAPLSSDCGAAAGGGGRVDRQSSPSGGGGSGACAFPDSETLRTDKDVRMLRMNSDVWMELMPGPSLGEVWCCGYRVQACQLHVIRIDPSCRYSLKPVVFTPTALYSAAGVRELMAGREPICVAGALSNMEGVLLPDIMKAESAPRVPAPRPAQRAQPLTSGAPEDPQSLNRRGQHSNQHPLQLQQSGAFGGSASTYVSNRDSIETRSVLRSPSNSDGDEDVHQHSTHRRDGALSGEGQGSFSIAGGSFSAVCEVAHGDHWRIEQLVEWVALPGVPPRLNFPTSQDQSEIGVVLAMSKAARNVRRVARGKEPQLLEDYSWGGNEGSGNDEALTRSSSGRIGEGETPPATATATATAADNEEIGLLNRVIISFLEFLLQAVLLSLNVISPLSRFSWVIEILELRAKEAANLLALLLGRTTSCGLHPALPHRISRSASTRSVCYVNYIIRRLVDMLLGALLSTLLVVGGPSLYAGAQRLTRFFLYELHMSYMEWFDGWPAGLKMNEDLNLSLSFLAKLVLECWDTLMIWTPSRWFAFGLQALCNASAAPTEPGGGGSGGGTAVYRFASADKGAGTDYLWIVPSYNVLVTMSILGASCAAAMVADLTGLVTIHLRLLFHTVSLLYRLTKTLVGSLFRQFRGLKRNPLRNRIDACDFQTDQMLMATFLFTISAFLFPTLAVYYIYFALIRVSVWIVQETLVAIAHATLYVPVFPFLHWVFMRHKLFGGIAFSTPIPTISSKYTRRGMGEATEVSFRTVELEVLPTTLPLHYMLTDFSVVIGVVVRTFIPARVLSLILNGKLSKSTDLLKELIPHLLANCTDPPCTLCVPPSSPADSLKSSF